MIKFFALLGVLGLTFATSTLTMIYGWGVSPHSWLIIAAGWLTSFFLMAITQAINVGRS